MTVKGNFKRMFEEAENAPSYSEEQMKAQANIWNWNMESNLRIWDEIGRERRAEGKKWWNEFAQYVLDEIHAYAKIMKEVKDAKK